MTTVKEDDTDNTDVVAEESPNRSDAIGFIETIWSELEDMVHEFFDSTTKPKKKPSKDKDSTTDSSDVTEESVEGDESTKESTEGNESTFIDGDKETESKEIPENSDSDEEMEEKPKKSKKSKKGPEIEAENPESGSDEE